MTATGQKKITIGGLDDIDRAAAEFAQAIGQTHIIAFHGAMGAGKTTFISAFCRHFGVEDTVTSPTFAIVNEYTAMPSGQPIFHFDFYRLKSAAEAADIGLDDYLDSGALCLMEWPELIANQLPDDTLHVSIEEQPDGTRTLTLGTTPPSGN